MRCNGSWLPVLVFCLIFSSAPFAGELELLPLGDPELAFRLGSAAEGGFYDSSVGEEITLEEAADRMAGAHVILLGEEHTDLEQHRTQASLIRELGKRIPNLALGMEFFLRDQEETLRRYTSGELTGEDFLLESGWYDRGGLRFDYYEPLLDAARDLGLPVYGLNIPREILRSVNRKGLESLTSEEQAVVGEVIVDGSPGHRFLIGRYFGDTLSQMPPGWFDNMYAAQCVWDTIMARSILDRLPEEGAMVVVVGQGHVSYGLGISRRIQEEAERRGLPPITVATYGPVTAPAPDPEGHPMGHPTSMTGMGEEERRSRAVFVRSLCDFVGVFPDTGGVEPFPLLGISLKEEDGEMRVSMVFPGSIGEEAGLERGDVILDLTGKVPSDLHRLKLHLFRLEWGERMDLRVRRGEEELHAVALLQPDVVEEEATAPGWTSKAVSTFDPWSGEPVPEAAEAKDGHADSLRLISRDGVPLRVEVRSDETLLAVHDLDEALHVTRSLYREPLGDETVEIHYKRDAEGRVQETLRYDRTGEILTSAEARRADTSP